MLSPLVLPVLPPRPQISNHATASSPSFPRSPMASLYSKPPFDDIVYRLQQLSIPPSPLSTSCSLDPPFSLPFRQHFRAPEDDHNVIDTFAPRRHPIDLSPVSSAGSDRNSSIPHFLSPYHPVDHTSVQAFIASRSRVVRFFNLPRPSAPFLSAIFFPPNQDYTANSLPTPVTMWVLRQDQHNEEDSVWAVFKSHEEACASLSIFAGTTLSIATALESDLEPFQKLRRFELHTPSIPPSPVASLPPPSPSAYPQLRSLRMSSSVSDLQRVETRVDAFGGLLRSDYTLSTNPPNPRTSFRLGDWICPSPNCAAHNFGRNLACIGCGCPRPGNGASPSPQMVNSNIQATRLPSPRFATPSSSASFAQFPFLQSPSSATYPGVPHSPYPDPSTESRSPIDSTKSPASSHPILTPSGRAFAAGGKVQNISTDPLSPCVMYWPDNEPIPEQGQIRPSGLIGVPQPPILNTGNRGPIEHQPGDWICLKCNYLNWRRRKVCQTCYPYAEGNGDSISAAVQAERIALLTSVLAQAQSVPQSTPSPVTISSHPPAVRSHSLTPPNQMPRCVDLSPPQHHGPVHRSQSHFDLGAQYANARPIYQTSGHPSGHRQASLPFPSPSGFSSATHTPAPLLPSFLQDIVQSPTLSPTSTSSADLSFEDYDDSLPSPRNVDRLSNGSDSSLNLPLSNIWKLDGEETKKLSAVVLPNHHRGLMGERKTNSREALRQSNTP